MFSAYLQDDPEDKIVAKFAGSYGEDVHVHGFAPKLRAVERFADEWVMVVMDDISRQYCGAEGKKLRTDVHEAVKRDGMDSEGLRDVVLIDFDWTGSVVRYPLNITLDHPGLWRPKSVERRDLMTFAHDDGMLEFLSPV